MLPATRGLEASNAGPESSKTNVILETLGIFFVLVVMVAMLLAITTVFQNGFQ